MKNLFEMSDDEVAQEIQKAQRNIGILIGIAFLAFIIFVTVVAVAL